MEKQGAIESQQTEESKVREIAEPIEHAQKRVTSWVCEVVCPNCGKKCYGNLPPRPGLRMKLPTSDAACKHCGARIRIRRHRNGDPEIILPDSTATYSQPVQLSSAQIPVGLVAIGSALPKALDLHKVARKLTKAQDTFEFWYVEWIEYIGNPDLKPNLYEADRLLCHLRTETSVRYLLGVTAAGIIQHFHAVELNDREKPAKVILSLSGSLDTCSRARRNEEECLIIGIVASILYASYLQALMQHGGKDKEQIEKMLSDPGTYSDDLYHQEVRGCLFDVPEGGYAGHAALAKCRICTSCASKLREVSVGTSILATADEILRGIRKPTISKTINSIFSDPVLSFLFGGLFGSFLVNLLSSMFESIRNYAIPIVLLLLAAFILVKYVYDLLQSKA